MATTPTEPAPARVLDEEHHERTEWRVERMGATRWLVYAAIAAAVVALLSLVATAVALWLR